MWNGLIIFYVFGDAFFIALDFDSFGRKASYHIGEKFCVEDDGSVFADVGGHIGCDAKLHIVAAEDEVFVLGDDENSFQCGMSCFCGNGAGYIVERFGKFLAAARKFHKISSR